MRIDLFLLLLALTWGLALPAAAVTCSIAPDRMAEVDGKRVLILGLYENPQDDAVLARVAEAGFNLVRCSEDAGALDRLEKHGLWAWLNTGGRIDLSVEAGKREAQLTEMVEKWGQHPALLVWEVPDEALWNCWYGAQGWRTGAEPKQQADLIRALENKQRAAELQAKQAEVRALRQEGRYAESEQLADAIWKELGKEPPRPGYGISTAPARAAKMCAGMVQGYQKLRALDPKHPVWMNHAPRNQIAQLAAFNEGADIVGCDIYPVPFSRFVGHSDLGERTVAAAGAYTGRMQAAAPGKPAWMVLQGFGWGDILPERPEEERKILRRPDLGETRFMAYDAIVHGARGILYWGTHAIEKDSQLFEDLLTLAKELDGLQPVLSAPDAPLDLSVTFAPTWGSVDREVVVLPKAVGDNLWLLVVNEWTDALTYTIRGLGTRDGVAYTDTQSGQSATVAGGALTLTIPAQQIHVLEPK